MMNISKTVSVIIACIWLVSLSFAEETEYEVTGTISTPNEPVRWARVEVWDDDVGPDDFKGSTYTDNQGDFSVTFSENELPDVYFNVILVHASGAWNTVTVKHFGGGDDAIEYSKPGGTVYDAEQSPIEFNLVCLSDSRGTIGGHAVDCLDWVQENGGLLGPVLSDMVAYDGGDGSHQSYFMFPNSIYIEFSQWNNAGTIWHETGHFVHYEAHGEHFSGDVDRHTMEMETDEKTALIEGFAEYIQYQADPTSLASANAWRGLHQPDVVEWVFNTGTDNAGDIVEGAVQRIFISLDDFAGIYGAIADGTPTHFKAWLDQYGENHDWEVDNLMEACQENGIVYTRAKISVSSTTVPSDAVNATTGSSRKLNGIMYLRGDITPNVGQLTKADLNLSPSSSAIPAEQKALWTKPAEDGILQGQPDLANWTKQAEEEWDDLLTFETGELSDGDYDLVVQAKAHGWGDILYPDFWADNSIYTATEKWLKHNQTWFRSGGPDDFDDDKGKVTIDNTQPKISNCKP